MGKIKSTGKVVVSFDDYGMKECKDTFEGEKLKVSFFSDGLSLYKVIHASKEVFKAGPAYRGTELRFDWEEIPAKDKKEGRAIKTDDMTIAGKICQSFKVTDRGSTTHLLGGGTSAFSVMWS